MFRTFARIFLPNRLDWILRRAARKGGKKILLGWNRGLGDIALGLYAMVQRIREWIPGAQITFFTRENLLDGFSMLEGVKTIPAPGLKRGEPTKIPDAIKKQFDLVIEKPSPTDWVYWQRGKVIPRLKWDLAHESVHQKFPLPRHSLFIGVQVVAETNYGLWRNWPLQRWQELFDRLEKSNVKVLLFGYGDQPRFKNGNCIDLRGKTTLLELLSIIKNRCAGLVLPDSGISSMTYYLDASFPIRLVSLWADPNHGILKQNTASPNPQLVHCPLIGKERDLSTVSSDAVFAQLFPLAKVGAILLAGGQGTRLGVRGPKGLFSIAGKTLFQWICEKIPPHVPLAIMTCPMNHEETVAYFKREDFFGREIYFFQQETASFLDAQKQPMDMQGPNGNGNLFRAFVKAGLDRVFASKGIDLVTVSYIDNPLTNPVDLALISYARKTQAEAVVQCIERRKTDRSLGALVEKAEQIEIVEYTEQNPQQEYQYAYSGQIAFDFSFFCKMADVALPLHWVEKKAIDTTIWKAEQFIFDAFPYAKRVRAFLVPRETHYAPLKNPEHVEMVEKVLRGGS